MKTKLFKFFCLLSALVLSFAAFVVPCLAMDISNEPYPYYHYNAPNAPGSIEVWINPNSPLSEAYSTPTQAIFSPDYVCYPEETGGIVSGRTRSQSFVCSGYLNGSSFNFGLYPTYVVNVSGGVLTRGQIIDRFRYTDRQPDTVSRIRINFEELIYDWALSQGNSQFWLDSNFISDVSNLSVYCYQSGILLYPLKEGGFYEYSLTTQATIPMFYSELVSGQINLIHCPSIISQNGFNIGSTKIDPYQFAYDDLSDQYDSLVSSSGSNSPEALELADLISSLRHPNDLRNGNIVNGRSGTTACLKDFSIYLFVNSEDGSELPWRYSHNAVLTRSDQRRQYERMEDFQQISSVTLTNFNFVGWIGNLITGFLNIELFPGFYLYYPLAAIVGLSLVMWILKLFAGG